MAEEEIARILACTSHYEVLRVTASASDAEIRRRYRDLALQTHPDKNPHAKSAEAFNLVTGAYQCLETEEKRERYSGRGLFRPHEDEGEDGEYDFEFDATAFFNLFMRAQMARGMAGGGGGAEGMEEMFLQMMMQEMFHGSGGGGGMSFDEDGYYYEDGFDDDYFDDGEEGEEEGDADEDEDEDEEEEEEPRPGQYDRKLKLYVCAKCQVSTSTRDDMIEHLGSHEHELEMDKLSFTCPSCQVSTSTLQEKEQHLSSREHLRNLRRKKA